MNVFQNSTSSPTMTSVAGTSAGTLDYRDPLTPGPSRGMAIESNFALFGMMFAIWVLIDQSFFPQWMNLISALFTAPLAAAVILRPNSVKLFLGMMTASLWSFWCKSPFEVNNVLIGGFFASLVLMGAGVYVIKHKKLPDSLGDLEASCFPAIRIGVIVVFLFAVLHKTNTAFLDPAISCACMHYKNLHRMLTFHGVSFVPALSSTAGQYAVIWLTWCTELSIPIVLTAAWVRFPSRRLMTFGIVLALGFHFVMSFNGYQNFSMMALAYYVPFLPMGFSRSASDAISSLRTGRFASLFKLIAFAATTIVVVFGIELFLFAVIKIARPNVTLRGEKFLRNEGWFLFNFVLYPIVTLAFVWISYLRWNKQPNEMAGGWLKPWSLIPLFVVAISSLSPYLGLKTENSFAMFSNLLTEGDLSHWNHSFLPKQLRIFHYQDHLVSVRSLKIGGRDTNKNSTPTPSSEDAEVEGGSGATLAMMRELKADPRFRIVEFEFRRNVARACKTYSQPIEIEYEIDGQIHHVADAHDVPELANGNGYLIEKLLFFRKVPNSPYGICLH